MRIGLPCHVYATCFPSVGGHFCILYPVVVGHTRWSLRGDSPWQPSVRRSLAHREPHGAISAMPPSPRLPPTPHPPFIPVVRRAPTGTCPPGGHRRAPLPCRLTLCSASRLLLPPHSSIFPARPARLHPRRHPACPSCPPLPWRSSLLSPLPRIPGLWRPQQRAHGGKAVALSPPLPQPFAARRCRRRRHLCAGPG